MINEFISVSEADLIIAAKKLFDKYPSSRVFAFYGSMGAGKTTFIKVICHYLGATDIVQSPSFAIINEYQTNQGESLFHFDFYRIKKIEEAYAHLGSMTMMELLEVDEKADSDALRKSYYRLTKEFHPDRHFSSDDYSTKMKLTAIFDALTKAYNTLSDEQKRGAYIASLRSRKQEEGADAEARAAEQHREGIAEFKKGNYRAAIEKFTRATQLAPKNAVYLSYLSLAYSKVPEHGKEAEEALLAALKIEPFNAEFHSHLGLVYMKAGLKKKAHSSFQKALRIDPGNERAKKGLEQTR